MQRRVFPGVPALALAVLMALAAPAAAADASSVVSHQLRGLVARVLDGDTVRLQGENRRYYTVRLASIDAPETGNGHDRPAQPFSRASRNELERLVNRRHLVADCYEVDHYGRDICDLLLPDGGTASQAMVRAGLAWANLERGGKFLRDASLRGLEHEARAQRRGLWSQPGAVAPWQWRQDCWRQGRCD